MKMLLFGVPIRPFLGSGARQYILYIAVNKITKNRCKPYLDFKKYGNHTTIMQPIKDIDLNHNERFIQWSQ